MPLVYRELRRIAGHQMRDERVGHTLQPTALVHEAFLRLVDQSRADWQNRPQFLGVAAQLMRRLLVDHARQRHAAKRGIPVTLNEEILHRGPGADQTEEILAVDEVLDRLAELDPRQARVVELRYFGGLSVEETAEVLGIAARTVKLDWAMAKGWMQIAVEPESTAMTPAALDPHQGDLRRGARDPGSGTRRRFLESACGGDADLRAEVERMLAGNEEPSWQSPAANAVHGRRPNSRPATWWRTTASTRQARRRRHGRCLSRP